MDDALGRMVTDTEALNAKMAAIHETAGKISMVTNAMTRVVDQTNLLSVNSAIEAEKAGEFAGGFRVVSSEIQRLAERTAAATLEIEGIVKGVRGSVSAGVQEVGRFEEQVRENVGQARTLAERFNDIVADVGTLSERFSEISAAMARQATGSERIRVSIGRLEDGAEQIAASSREFTDVTAQLYSVVERLKQQVSAFG